MVLENFGYGRYKWGVHLRERYSNRRMDAQANAAVATCERMGLDFEPGYFGPSSYNVILFKTKKTASIFMLAFKDDA